MPRRSMTDFLLAAECFFLMLSCWPTTAQTATIVGPGTFDAGCLAVTIKGTGAITIYNPTSLSFSLQGTSTAVPNVLIAQNGSGAACATSPLTIAAGVFTSVGETISFSFGSTSRDIVVQPTQMLSGSGSKAIFNLGSGSLWFTAATFSIVGSITATFNATNTGAPRFTALKLVNGTIVGSIVGSTFLASIATLTSARLSLVGVSSLSLSANSLWTSSTVTLLGDQSNSSNQQSNSTFFVNTSGSFSMISSTLTILRGPQDTGSVILFPSLVGIFTVSASSFLISCGGSSTSQDVVLGGLSTTLTQQKGVTFTTTTYGSVFLPAITTSPASSAMLVSIMFLSRGSTVNISSFGGYPDYKSGLSITVSIQAGAPWRNNNPMYLMPGVLLNYNLQFTSITSARWVNLTGAFVRVTVLSVASSALFSSWPASLVLQGLTQVNSPFSLSTNVTADGSVILGSGTKMSANSAITFLSSTSAVPCSNSSVIMSGSFGPSAIITATGFTLMFDESANFTASSTVHFLGCSNRNANFVVRSGAQFASPTFNIVPTYMGSVLFEDGVVMSGPATISIVPLANTNSPSTVTLAGISVISGTLTVSITMQGPNDKVYISASAPSVGSFVGNTVVDVNGTKECNNQQSIILGTPPTTPSITGRSFLQSMSITGIFLGGGLSAYSTTLMNVNIMLTTAATIASCVTITPSTQSPTLTLAALEIRDSVSIGMSSAPTRIIAATVSMIGCTIIGTSMTIQGSMQNFFLSNTSAPLGPLQSSLVISSAYYCLAFTIAGFLVNTSVSMLGLMGTMVSNNAVLSGSALLRTLSLSSSCGCNLAFTALCVVNSSVAMMWPTSGCTFSFAATRFVNSSLAISMSGLSVASKNLIAINILSASQSFISIDARYAFPSITTCSAAATTTVTNCAYSVAVASLQLSDSSTFQFLDQTASYFPKTSLNIDSASATNDSNFNIVVGGSASFSGFGTVSASSVSIKSTAKNFPSFGSSLLQVSNSSVVTLQETIPYSFSSFTIQATQWLSGSTLSIIPALTNAPYMSVQLSTGLYINFTLNVASSTLLTFSGSLTFTSSTISIRSSTTVTSAQSIASSLTFYDTSFTWSAACYEQIAPLVTAPRSQVQIANSSILSLSSDQCCVTKSPTVTSVTFNATLGTQLPTPGGTLDVSFGSSCKTNVVVDGLNAMGSSLVLRSASIVSISGVFTANTTFSVIGASDVNISFASLDISRSSAVLITTRSPLQQLFTPKRIADHSLLALEAPGVSQTGYTVTGAAVSQSSTLYVSLATASITIAALTAAGCSFTIIAWTITTVGAAIGSGANISLQTNSTTVTPPSLDLTSSLGAGVGYNRVTFTARVAIPQHIDALIAGIPVKYSNVTLISTAACSASCTALTVDGTLLSGSSALTINIPLRAVTLYGLNSSGRNSTISITSTVVTVNTTEVVDTTLNLTMTSVPTPQSFIPSAITRSNIFITVVFTVTLSGVRLTYVPSSPYSYWNSLLSLSDRTELILRGLSTLSLASQYSLNGVVLDGSTIPATDTFPNITLNSSGWGSGSIVQFSEFRANVVVSSVGSPAQQNILLDIDCHTLRGVEGSLDFGAIVQVAARNFTNVSFADVRHNSTVNVFIQGALNCGAVPLVLCAQNITGGSSITVSINDTTSRSLSTIGQCTASLCNGLTVGSALNFSAPQVSFAGSATSSVIEAVAQQFSVSDSATFTNSLLVLDEKPSSATQSNRPPLYFNANNSTIVLTSYLPVASAELSTMHISAPGLTDSTLSIRFRGANGSLATTPIDTLYVNGGLGVRSNLAIDNVGSVVLSGLYENSKANVTNVRGNVTLTNVSLVGNASNIFIAAASLRSVLQNNPTVGSWNLTAEQITSTSPLAAVTVVYSLDPSFDADVTPEYVAAVNRSCRWFFGQTQGPSTRANTICRFFSAQFTNNTKAITIVIPLLDGNGLPLPSQQQLNRSSLSIAGADQNTMIDVDLVGALFVTGNWTGTRGFVKNIYQQVFLNASMNSVTFEAHGANGVKIPLQVHGSLSGASYLLLRELNTSSNQSISKITDLPISIVTATVTGSSNVVITGLTRRWVPGADTQAILDATSLVHINQPIQMSTGRYQLSTTVAPVAVVPVMLEQGSSITVVNYTSSVWLQNGSTPTANAAVSRLLPTGAVLDNATISSNVTSVVYSTILVLLSNITPNIASSDETPPARVLVLNSTLSLLVDPGMSLPSDAVRAAHVSAIFNESGGAVEVVGGTMSMTLQSSISEVQVVEALMMRQDQNSTIVLPGGVAVRNINVSMNSQTGSSSFGAFRLISMRPAPSLSVDTKIGSWSIPSSTPVNDSVVCVVTGSTKTCRFKPVAAIKPYNSPPYTSLTSGAMWSAEVDSVRVDWILVSNSTFSNNNSTAANISTTVKQVSAISARNVLVASIVVRYRTFRVTQANTTINTSLLTITDASLVDVNHFVDNSTLAYVNLPANIVVDLLTTIVVQQVNSLLLFAAAVTLRNVNTPTNISVMQLNFSASSNASTSAGVGEGALISITYIPCSIIGEATSTTLLPYVGARVIDSNVMGQQGAYPLVRLRRAVMASIVTDTILLPAVVVSVEGSTIRSVTTLLSTNSTTLTGVLAPPAAAVGAVSGASRFTVFNSTVLCSTTTNAQQLLKTGVVVVSPLDAIPFTIALSQFQGCLRVLSGSTNVSLRSNTNNFTYTATNTFVSAAPNFSWACTIWEQRSLTRSNVRQLIAASVASVYASPQIDSRYGKTICRSASNSVEVSQSISASVSDEITKTSSVSPTASLSRTGTPTTSPTTTLSVSPTATRSPSPTETDSPTISIDPCNTTFRNDSDSFIRQATVLTSITEHQSPLIRNETSAIFLTIDRVAFATVKSIRVQIGFNIFIRNFYYDTNMSWFPLPTLTENCIAGEYELVNATDIALTLSYDPDVSLSHNVDQDYLCNVTFSTDIFQCQLVTNFTFNFSATMHVTGTPAILSPAAEASAKLTSALITLLSSGAALLQQSRADSLAALASCQFSLITELSVQDSPTQLGFGSEMQYYYRGSIVGNLSIIAGFFVFVLLFSCVAALCCRRNVDVLRDRPEEPPPCDAKGTHTDEVDVVPWIEPEVLAATAKDSLIAEIVIDGNTMAPQLSTFEALYSEGVFGAAHHDTYHDGMNVLTDDGEHQQPNSALAAQEDLAHTQGCSDVEQQQVVNANPEVMSEAPEKQKSLVRTDLVVSYVRRETFVEALARTCATLCFPSIVGLPLLLVADSTMLAAVRLLVHPIDSDDKLIASIAIAFFGVFLVTCSVYAVRYLRRSPRAVVISKRHPLWLREASSEANEESRSSRSERQRRYLRNRARRRSIVLFLRYWLVPTIEYESIHRRHRHGYGMARLFFEDSQLFFEDSHVPLLICADLALSLLIASVVGVGISRREVCVYLAGVGSFGYLLFFAFIVILRPNICRLQLLTNIVSTFFGLYSSVTTLAAMWGGFVVLGTINQYLSIVMMVVSMIQFVSTLLGVAAWFRIVGSVMFASQDALLNHLGLGEVKQTVSVYQNIDGEELDSVGEATPPRSASPSSSSSCPSSEEEVELAPQLPEADDEVNSVPEHYDESFLRFVGRGTEMYDASGKHVSLLIHQGTAQRRPSLYQMLDEICPEPVARE
ncbi:membrane-associated protein, putative [Bodo saltans]|uniref:Membrane-associated protein, putative n=1 Tax=Bodo saltans TaxID=75058 RepID=A0A0S4IU19_BODSA|nr:membrane-associated protein, putative [Bodo saltans]|eukprot:CUG07747.1 membrane-associated protein, putative [Bodo saltans]